MDSAELQRIIFDAIETIAQKIISEQDMARVVEAQVTRVDSFGDGVYYMYQGREELGFKLVSDEDYCVGDMVQVLVSTNPRIKNLILTKS